MPVTYVWIAAGGAIGSVLRFWFSNLIAETVGQTFPWGTLAVNIIGSMVIGFTATLTGPDGRFLVSPDVRAFILVGVCGGYTTFSSFSLQTLSLARDGEWLHAGMNIVLSVVLCLISVWLGHILAATFNQIKG